jgi:hypothetical protein
MLSILGLSKTGKISGCSKVAVIILHEVLPPDIGVRKFGTGIKLDNTFHPGYECAWIAYPTIGEWHCAPHSFCKSKIAILVRAGLGCPLADTNGSEHWPNLKLLAMLLACR